MSDLGGPYDVVVIGAGMSGLVAANVLARHGRRVLILEQHYHFGGYLQNFMLHRTPFDSGCHYVGALGPGQMFDRYLRYLGVRDALSAHALDPNGYDVLVSDGFQFSIPVGYPALLERMAEAFGDQRAAIARFLHEVQAEVEHFPMYTLRTTDAPMGRSPFPDRTVKDVLDTCGVTDVRAREVLSAYRALYFVPADEAPFSMHAFTFDSFVQGPYTFHGGGNAVQKALLRQLRALGGVARRRVRVVGVDVKDRAVTGIRTADGAYERTSRVIAAIDPKVAVALLPEGAVRPAYVNRVKRLRPGIGGLGAYLRLSDDVDLTAHRDRNYFLSNARVGKDGLFSERWLSEGSLPPVFVTASSTREPGWSGPQSVVVLTGLKAEHFERWRASQTGRRDVEYEHYKRALGERMVRAAARVMPEIETSLLTADFSTPLTHRDYTLNEGGAIYGIHHDVRQSAGRGVSWRTRVKGFYLSGHSVLFPGLIGAMISAFYTCGEIVGLRKLHREVCAA